MRRSLQIVVALMAVFLFVRPFDCLAGPQSDQKAKNCCKKGNCKPSNSDDCCKAIIQDGGQLLTPKATEQPSPILDAVTAEMPISPTQPVVMASLFFELHAPPGSPPNARLNLPLLI